MPYLLVNLSSVNGAIDGTEVQIAGCFTERLKS
jgi:hypothetical protein